MARQIRGGQLVPGLRCTVDICRRVERRTSLAKTHRDARMQEWDTVYPQYGLARHKGYATPDHLEALRLHGPSPLHRYSFAPVRDSGCWAAGATQTPLPIF